MINDLKELDKTDDWAWVTPTQQSWNDRVLGGCVTAGFMLALSFLFMWLSSY